MSLKSCAEATALERLRMKSAKRGPDQWAGLSFKGPEYRHPGLLGNSELLLDLPYRVVGDVYRERANRFTSRCVHRNASKWLGPGDTLVLAGAACDEMGPTIHFRLRLVEIARIEAREPQRRRRCRS